MANKRIPELPEKTNAEATDKFVMHNAATDTTYHIKAENLLPTAEIPPDAWSNSIEYDPGTIVSYDGIAYISTAEPGNFNKIPPLFIAPTVPTFWVLVDSQVGAGIPLWAAGLYEQEDVSVYKVIDGELRLARLASIVRPYNSTDFDAELALGDWELVAGGSGGGSTSPALPLGQFRFQTATTPNPTAAHLRLNNATQNSATEIYIDHLTQDGIDVDIFLAEIKTGDHLYLQDKTDSTQNKYFEVTGPAVVDVPNTFVTIPVVFNDSQGADFVNNQDISVAIYPVGSVIAQATEGDLGVARLATQAQANAGVDDLTILTPLKASRRAMKIATANISGAVSIDLSTAEMFILTLTANVTSFTFTNETLGKQYVFVFKQDTSYKTLAFTAAKFAFPFGNAPALTNPTTNGTAGPAYSKDIFTALCTEAGKLDIVSTPDLINN